MRKGTQWFFLLLQITKDFSNAALKFTRYLRMEFKLYLQILKSISWASFEFQEVIVQKTMQSRKSRIPDFKFSYFFLRLCLSFKVDPEINFIQFRCVWRLSRLPLKWLSRNFLDNVILHFDSLAMNLRCGDKFKIDSRRRKTSLKRKEVKKKKELISLFKSRFP